MAAVIIEVPGLPGPGNELVIGTVTTGPPGGSADATISGTAPTQTLDLVLPTGDPGPQGPDGPANSLDIGTVTTGAAGDAATATITGSAPNQVLNLTIPQGIKGDTGDVGPSAPDASATVKGISKLTNDFGGTADLPTVVSGTHHTHTSSQVTDATDAATSGTVVKRDGSGNFSVNEPTASANPASKNYVDSKTWASTAISDSTAVGRSVMTAASSTAARTAIGAGTSNLAIGTTNTTAKAGDYQPSSSNISDSTTVGRALIVAVDAATARTAIGAGTSNLAIGTTSTTAKAGDYQPTSANITDATSAATASVVVKRDAAGRAQFASPSAAADVAIKSYVDGKTWTASTISDSTTVGRSVLTAADAPTARTAIGAGTSNLAIGTTNTTAKAGDYQPTAANISDATTVGRAVLTAVDAATARTTIGAGTSNLALGTTSTTAKAGDYQPAAANISDSTTTGRALITTASASAARTTLGVPSVSGGITDIVQLTQSAYDALGTKVSTTMYVIVG